MSAFGDFLNISFMVPSEGAAPQSPSMDPLQRERCFIPRDPFIHLSKSPVGEPSSRFPKWGPYGRRCPSPEPFLNPDILIWSLKSPGKQTPNRAPVKREVRLQGILSISQKNSSFWFPSKGALLLSSVKVPGIRALPPHQVPLGRKGAPMERDAHIRRLSQHIFQSPQ